MIELQQLRFAWPRAGHDCLAVETLQVTAGETLFMHGPSGCGKSTLLSLLAGVLVPREGTVSLAGTAPGRRCPARRAMPSAPTMSATCSSSSTCCPS